MNPKASDRGGNPLSTTVVEQFASIGVVSCDPDTPLAEVAALMGRNRVHAVVVSTGESDAPVIADTDLIAAAESEDFDSMRAIDIAGTESVDVAADERLDRAAQLLREHGITHLIVRDAQRTPAGVLSTLDVARALARED